MPLKESHNKQEKQAHKYGDREGYREHTSQLEGQEKHTKRERDNAQTLYNPFIKEA